MCSRMFDRDPLIAKEVGVAGCFDCRPAFLTCALDCAAKDRRHKDSTTEGTVGKRTDRQTDRQTDRRGRSDQLEDRSAMKANLTHKVRSSKYIKRVTQARV